MHRFRTLIPNLFPLSVTCCSGLPNIGTAISSFLLTQFVLTLLSRRPLLSQTELQKSWQEEDVRRWLVCWSSCSWQRECLCLSFLLLMGAPVKSSLAHFPRNLNQAWKLRLGASGKSSLVYFPRNWNRAWNLRLFSARKNKTAAILPCKKRLENSTGPKAKFGDNYLWKLITLIYLFPSSILLRERQTEC